MSFGTIMTKLNLLDVTFIIPVRIDSDERIRNITTVLKYLTKYFDTNIIVMEDDVQPKVATLVSQIDPNIKYIFNQNNNPLLHRTKMLNDMIKMSTTPYIVNHDTDVLLKPVQYVSAINALRNNQLDFVFPYNGRFIDILGATLELVLATLSVDNIQEYQGNLIHPNSLGGCVCVNKSKFMTFLESEKCISWGFEDNIRLIVAQKLGLRIGRIDGCLFHMYHRPSLNSANSDHPAYKANEAEYH